MNIFVLDWEPGTMICTLRPLTLEDLRPGLSFVCRGAGTATVNDKRELVWDDNLKQVSASIALAPVWISLSVTLPFEECLLAMLAHPSREYENLSNCLKYRWTPSAFEVEKNGFWVQVTMGSPEQLNARYRECG